MARLRNGADPKLYKPYRYLLLGENVQEVVEGIKSLIRVCLSTLGEISTKITKLSTNPDENLRLLGMVEGIVVLFQALNFRLDQIAMRARRKEEKKAGEGEEGGGNRGTPANRS